MRYVWKLDVHIPEEYLEPGWSPQNWKWDDHDHSVDFSWPPRRMYLTRSGAERRAKLLTGWGATVRVLRSEPLIFPDEDLSLENAYEGSKIKLMELIND